MQPSNLEILLNHESATATHIIRNKKVECTFNMPFKKFSHIHPLVGTDVLSVYPIAKELLLNELNGGNFHGGPFVKQSPKETFSVGTDLDDETFETNILKHRKTIRFRISADLLASLFYGVEEPHNSIFAYIFQLDDPFKLTIFTTESMKGKKSKNIIKFDIFKKVKISAVHTNFMIGIIVLTNSNGFDKNARLHILNGMTVFSKMIDNEKKRKSSSQCESPTTSIGYSDNDITLQTAMKKAKVNEQEGEESKKFELFMKKLGKDFNSMKTIEDLKVFCREDDRSKILLQLLNQLSGNSKETQVDTKQPTTLVLSQDNPIEDDRGLMGNGYFNQFDYTESYWNLS